MDEPKQTRMRTHNFLPLATALKWYPRNEIPRHFSYTLSSNMSTWFHSFTLGVNFTEYQITRVDGEDFSF